MPLRRKGRVIGALNLLSDTPGSSPRPTRRSLRQFGAHVAVAIENARLFEHEREYTEHARNAGRDRAASSASILNLDELLTRIANLTRRVIDYRTFGILLLNDETSELEMKVAVRYGDKVTVPAREARRRAGRLRRAAQGGGARARRVQPIRATSRWWTTRDRSW